MPRKPTGRRRGGQPGNHNRLKHGMYARKLPIELELWLERRGLNHNHLDIDVARARLNQLLAKQAAAPPRDYLAYERAIQYYLDHITRLLHRNARSRLKPSFASQDLLTLVEMLNDPHR